MSQGDGRMLLWWAVGIPAGLVVTYLVLFLVAVLDEVVFGTHWLEDVMSEEVYDGVGVLMMPMSWLLERLGWI
ncbi:MAG: hypothetical protein P8J87_13410 [Verrucomicrobiales bacterium]|nr:hypothetical protein [Verrucomicrobiales bacterium]